MEWIDEQIEYWEKKTLENMGSSISLVELIRPYVELHSLYKLKIQILIAKNGKKS